MGRDRLSEAPLPATVRGLSWTSGLNDAASEMVYPLLPALLVGTLGAPALALGILDGAADLAAALLRIASGRIADDRRRRGPLVLAGYGIAAIARALIALARAVPLVIALRVVDRVGKGLRSPPRDAMLAEAVPPGDRGRAFGYHRAFDHGGAVVGSLLAWLLLSRGLSVPTVIALSAVPGVLMLWMVRRTVRQARQATDVDAPRRAARDGATVFWSAIAMLAVLIAVRLPETLLLLHLQRMGIAVAAVPLVWAALHVVRSAAAYPAGRLVDAVGERRVVALSGLLGAAGALGFALAPSRGWLVAAFLAVGLVTGVGEPAERTLVARLAPRGIGRAFGEAQALLGMAALLAGIGYGVVVDRRGSAFALEAWAALAPLATIGWLIVTRRSVLTHRATGQ